MRRKLQIVSILLALLLLLTACGKTDDPPPAVSHENEPVLPQEVVEAEEESAVSGPDYGVFSGIYRDLVPEQEGEEGYVQITVCRDFLMLEHFLCMDGSVYSFWAEEFWPYEDGFREGEWTSVYGQSQTFSLMTDGDGYDTPPQNRSIALTEEGIALTYDDADTEYYIKDDTFTYHSAPETLKQALGAGKADKELCGKWSWRNGAEAIFVSFEEDGTVSYLWKEAGEPALVYHGAFACDGKDTVQLLAEKIGDGQYPYAMGWQYKVDRDGMLWLTFEDGREMVLMSTDGSITDTVERQNALSYVGSVYDMTGEYEDQYDTGYTYTYRLPQFYGDDAAVMAVNDSITEKFAPLIEMELEAMEQEEFLSYTDVNWESDVFEGVLYLHIYAESFNWQEHSAYYYDLEQGAFLTTEEVLDRLLIEPSYFLEAVRQGAEETFESYFSDIPINDRVEYGYYELLEWTVSDEAVNFDLPIFVNRWGSIAVYARIGSMAGASEFRTVLYPFDGAVG
ncbi:MAG: hypothetical protein IJO88_08145 [Oscillospiraceae bacterium]|nr:hypothetical protein [Oscillospiraceae bacterium]